MSQNSDFNRNVDDPDAYLQDDAKIDRWNNGAIDGCKGIAAKSDDADYMEGYRHGQDERKVRVVMPKRPEGYYHAPIGTFDE
jgi:hypothetical protein